MILELRRATTVQFIELARFRVVEDQPTSGIFYETRKNHERTPMTHLLDKETWTQIRLLTDEGLVLYTVRNKGG